MKVAYVTQPYDGVLPPRQNSIGLIVYNTADAVRQWADVTVYLKKTSDSIAAGKAPFDVALVRSSRDDWVQTVTTRYPRWARRLGITKYADEFQGWASVVREGLNRSPVDVVHVMNYWGWSRLLRGPDRRVVLEMQSEWLSQMNPREVAEQLRHVDAVIAVSGHVERLFRAAFPKYPGIVETVHNGVDTDVFHPGTTEPDSGSIQRLLFVGRVSPEKGVHTLLGAFARVAERFPRAHLDIVGPRTELPSRLLVDLSEDPLVQGLKRFYPIDGNSSYQLALDALIKQMGLSDRVTFHGSLPHYEIVKHYQSADVVVNPSLSETFGISIVEGMACGVPVVGTQVGGMLDTVTDDVGRAVPAEDQSRLAAAICEILGDAPLAKRLGTQGRRRAIESFTWKARGKRLLDVYRRLDG